MSIRLAQKVSTNKIGLLAQRRDTVRNCKFKRDDAITKLKAKLEPAAPSSQRLNELMPPPKEIQPRVFSTAPVASTTTTVVAQKAMGSTDTAATPAAHEKDAPAKTQPNSSARKTKSAAKKVSQGSSTNPVTSATTAVAKRKIAREAANKQNTVVTSKAITLSDTSAASSEGRLLTRPKTLFMIGSLVAGLGALIAKVGPALAGQLIVSNTAAFLSPGVATVSVVGKLALDATIATTVHVAMPVLLPIISTIVVATGLLVLLTYVACKILESIKSRIRAAFQAMVDSINSNPVGALFIKAANVGSGVFFGSGKAEDVKSLVIEGATVGKAAFFGTDQSENDQNIQMETDRPSPARDWMADKMATTIAAATEGMDFVLISDEATINARDAYEKNQMETMSF